jgi:hypothetical protein
VETIKKIEAGKLRPSQHLAALLADTLAIPAEERAAFLKSVRATLGTDCLARLREPATAALATPPTVCDGFGAAQSVARRSELAQ